jgi:SAM-dependent methyltransferase
MAFKCRICGLEGNHPSYRIREMMFGTREEFVYFQCPDCSCLQIADIPDDLGRYYPEQYYSYSSFERLAGSRWRHLRYATPGQNQQSGIGGWIGRISSRFSRPPKHQAWVRHAGIGPEAKILDVGCGNGKTLLKMHLGGFRHCTGVDPFIQETLHYPNGVTIHKQGLPEFRQTSRETFDLIMFHHSLEHMEDPQGMIRAAKGLLADGGKILVRVPVADSFAWDHYREHWIQIDAPRHLYLLTRKSMEILAGQAGLRVERVDYDSTKGQFIGSELYQRNIPGNAPEREKRIFSRTQQRDFKRRAGELNVQQRGDQAAFYFCKDES